MHQSFVMMGKDFDFSSGLLLINQSINHQSVVLPNPPLHFHTVNVCCIYSVGLQIVVKDFSVKLINFIVD